MTKYLGFRLRYVGFGLLLATVGLAQDLARMDEVVQYNVSNKKFMGSVLVARGEEISLNKGYGSANLEWNIPNSPATKFRLGSVTKQFTAAAALRTAHPLLSTPAASTVHVLTDHQEKCAAPAGWRRRTRDEILVVRTDASGAWRAGSSLESQPR